MIYSHSHHPRSVCPPQTAPPATLSTSLVLHAVTASRLAYGRGHEVAMRDQQRQMCTTMAVIAMVTAATMSRAPQAQSQPAAPTRVAAAAPATAPSAAQLDAVVQKIVAQER